MAAGLALLHVGAEVGGMTSFHAELSPDFIEVFHLLGRELLGAAQHPGLVQKLRIKLYGLHLQIGVQQRIGIGQSTVVLQQHCVKVLHVLETASGISMVEGLPYFAIGTHPRAMTASGMMGWVRGMPAMAKLVAYTGWACTTLLTSGRS